MPGQRLDKAWMLGGVGQRHQQVGNRCVEVVVQADEYTLPPQVWLQFFARDHFSGMFEQRSQSFEALRAETDLHLSFVELARIQANFETVEVNPAGYRKAPASLIAAKNGRWTFESSAFFPVG